MRFNFVLTAITILFSSILIHAETQDVRWVATEDKNAEFLHVIETINQKTGFHLSASDFLLVEDRDLANTHFKMFVQTAADIPINGHSVRVWTDLSTKDAVQIEATVQNDQQAIQTALSLKVWPSFTTVNPLAQQLQLRQTAIALVHQQTDDPNVREVKAKSYWEHGQLVYEVNIKAKHGTHQIKFQNESANLISQKYIPFPDSDAVSKNAADEFSLPALVFPIFEETENNHIQNRVVTQLRHLKKSVKTSDGDSYAALRIRQYLSDKYDPVLGLTPDGQANGFWSMADIKAKAAAIHSHLTSKENSFANGGVILEGRYATINIHPDAIKAFPGLNFTPQFSSIFKPSWAPVSADDSGLYEMVPGSSYLGKPLTYFEEAYQRPARRLPDHNSAEYMNDGFDEVQVYYAIDTLVESLQQIGFQDPELSTRPFNAFLYDPDIGSRDNAYYTDDTINFTTYSPEAQNYARDNSTIWHELGHGIMDRLMGDMVQLADTGGLSEGMADFVAALVIEKVTKGIPFEGSENFRIVNKTGFSLTNEVHDDGESYGGSMRDLLMLARTKYGIDGVKKVGDLTMETMRLCRNNPAITANVWFNHMLFADELGHAPVRAPGELKELILSALASRNFTFDGKGQAQFNITYDGNQLTSDGPGSRNKPIPVTLAEGEKATYNLQIAAIDGEAYKFAYPMKVRIQFRNGPLQGALHWDNEESNFVDYTLNSAADKITAAVSINNKCDFVNREDGSCVDFAYVQLWPAGATAPVAKKRFYLRLKPAAK